MKTSRREFLKVSGITGVGLVTVSENYSVFGRDTIRGSNAKNFNMCGYVAPKLETVRIGFIGLGNRGPGAVNRMSHIEGTDIKALCDIRPEKADAVKKKTGGLKTQSASLFGQT